MESFTFLLVVFTQSKLPFKTELKYILFHKPAFHGLINFSFENENCFNVRKAYDRKCYSSDLDYY